MTLTWYYPRTMSQDKLIKLVSLGDKSGTGKGQIYYTRKNKKKHADKKFEFKKYNPVTRTHMVFKEKK
jgi:ribosomal protein L33